MKNKIIISGATLLAALCAGSCSSFREAGSVQNIEPISVTFSAVSTLESVTSLEGLRISLYNPREDVTIVDVFPESAITIDGLIPGQYSISISGIVTGDDGNTYKLSVMENTSSVSLFTDGETLEYTITGIMFSPLIFKEIYYSGSKNGTANYFMDQFYELYNNSDEVLYLDGLYIGDLLPTTTPSTPTVWDADDTRNVFGRFVFRFPGEGTDYPLQPGESCVLASSAVDHGLDLFNPEIDLDLHDAEFEFFLGHANGDQPAPDMPLFHYGGSATGTLPTSLKQFLSSVFGGAYAIFRVPEGIDWTPAVEGSGWYAYAGTSTNKCARIPIEWVLDAVECGLDETKLTQKRVPSVLDEGMAYVGATYANLSIARRISEMVNINGDPIYVDDNNSSTDFLVDIDQPELGFGRKPEARRYGARMPAWNFTLQ